MTASTAMVRDFMKLSGNLDSAPQSRDSRPVAGASSIFRGKLSLAVGR